MGGCLCRTGSFAWGNSGATINSLVWNQGLSLVAVDLSPDYTQPPAPPVTDWELTILGAPITPVAVTPFGTGLLVYHPALATNPATNLKYTEGATKLWCGDWHYIRSFNLPVPYP